MMVHTDREKGVSLALLKRLVEQRLPVLIEMKARVDRGELISDYDIRFLEQAIHDTTHNHPQIMKFPEYSSLVGKLAQLYEQITSKALENERAQK